MTIQNLPAFTAADKEIMKMLGLTTGSRGMPFQFYEEPSLNGVRVERKGKTLQIAYSQLAYRFRGLGLLAEQKQGDFCILQTAKFQSCGVMLDCSRNGVPSLDAVKFLIRCLAVMGHTTLMLYTEDTYEIPERPYWGYMRGRYTIGELRSLDEYAGSFGIELIPCIQTLAHLQSALRWGGLSPIIDTGDILLADDEETYHLIDQMLSSCRRSFKSRRIHIGMDEAGMLGRGAYYNRHGDRKRFDIMCSHLARVRNLCEKHGFRPMIWSDMFFHLATGGYNEGAGIPPEELAKVPDGVDLVYWDYYADQKEVYASAIRKHQQFSNPLLFAGGAWKWSGFTPSLFHSLKVSPLALDACVEFGVQEVLVTAWGDNGAEAGIFSVLPVIQQYAEYNFQGNVGEDVLARRFKTCTGAGWRNFLLLDLPDFPCCSHDWAGANPSKYLLYQDPLLGLFDKHTTADYPAFYQETAGLLEAAEKQEPVFGYLFHTLAALCRLLSKKCRIGVRLKEAYLCDDTQGLQNCVEDLLDVSSLARKFRDAVELQWMKENKAAGFEVLDIRLAAIAARAESAARRVRQYLEGKIPCIEELTYDRLYFDERVSEQERLVTSCNTWSHIATACNL